MVKSFKEFTKLFWRERRLEHNFDTPPLCQGQHCRHAEMKLSFILFSLDGGMIDAGDLNPLGTDLGGSLKQETHNTRSPAALTP